MLREARTLVIACGALAHEVSELKRINGWSSFDVQCLPPELHNRPEKIPAAVRAKIHENRARYALMFIAYADCGTGGELDRMLEQEGVARLPGAHCYEFFAGSAAFAELSAQEPGTFYLTDFLLRHFERLVIQGLGIDRFPQLQQVYFQNYQRLVYLAQKPQAGAIEQARAIA
ncbi:MAG: DUF1638 domain-containing protein, partial [Proteobacteria bacterium]|nr:DUF1638 domain-containing protein [Pseudomonadota bacterium]